MHSPAYNVQNISITTKGGGGKKEETQNTEGLIPCTLLLSMKIAAVKTVFPPLPCQRDESRLPLLTAKWLTRS